MISFSPLLIFLQLLLFFIGSSHILVLLLLISPFSVVVRVGFYSFKMFLSMLWILVSLAIGAASGKLSGKFSKGVLYFKHSLTLKACILYKYNLESYISRFYKHIINSDFCNGCVSQPFLVVASHFHLCLLFVWQSRHFQIISKPLNEKYSKTTAP